MNTMENTLDIIEKRIRALELQMLPKVPHNSTNEDITELLLQANVMMSTALSGREAITKVLRNMSQINDYLDPLNGENEYEMEIKRQYLLEMKSELIATIRYIGEIEELAPFVDSADVKKAVDMYDKLQGIAANNAVVYKENEDLTHRTFAALQQYNDIIATIKGLFAQLNQSLSTLEGLAAPKKPTRD